MQHHFLCNISYVVIAESMGKSLKYATMIIVLLQPLRRSTIYFLIDCLNPPKGGFLMYSQSSDFVNVVTYRCNDGLQLELNRTCTITGWDKEALPCSK